MNRRDVRFAGSEVRGRSAAARSALLLAAAPRRQQAPDRSKPPVPGPAPALKLPPIQKRTLVERPAGLDRRDARGAGRRRDADRQVGRGGRSGRQVRPRELHGRDARRGRGHARRARAGRRGRLPRRVAQHRQLVRLVDASGCTRRCRSSTRRCRSWRTSCCGRRFRQTELERLRKERLTTHAADARQPVGARLGGVRAAASSGRGTATARRRWATRRRTAR